MATAVTTKSGVNERTKRFYRPELDALRFFAFLAVLIHHGPTSAGLPDVVSRAGAFGLSMFFLLSAYLITELLFREREETGTVTWSLFFMRRALRIWPLYYAAVAAGFVIGRLSPRHLWISGSATAAMTFFVTNWFYVADQLGKLLAPLWSISVEEQFYLVWPPIVKAGGKKFALAAAVLFTLGAVVWIGLFPTRGWRLWYDTPVEFLFFAGGVLIALATHGRSSEHLHTATRVVLMAAGLGALGMAASLGGVGTDHVEGITAAKSYLGFGGAVAGCGLIFYSVLGLSKIPGPLIYLGKISYGLYVFHAAIMGLLERFTVPLVPRISPLAYMVAIDSVTLLLCIAVAHLSYQYFEKPFLKIKQQYEVVRSRPA